MKKFKEFLCFMAALFLLLVLYVVFLVARLDNGMFTGGWHYFMLFLQDERFGEAVGNTYGIVLWPAFLAVAIFTVLRYLVRKKIKISALVYYLVSAVAGSIAAFANAVFVSWQFYRNICMFPVPTYELVWRSISADDILLCLQAGVLAAFVFWLGALLFSWLKKTFGK